METIGDLFSKMTFDPLAIVAAIIAFFATFGTFIAQKNFVLKKERYDKLIAPLFFAMEPHLFRKAEDYIINKADLIISQNRSLAGGKLLALLYRCKENPSQKNFAKLCSYINKEYDKSCRILYLKRRPYTYRVDRRQYRYRCFPYTNIIKQVFICLAALCIFLLAFAAALSLFDNILGLNAPIKQLLVHAAGYLTMFVILRHFYKNF